MAKEKRTKKISDLPPTSKPLPGEKIVISPNPSNPFVIGNQFWKNRSKHGRDKLFATPELLWEEAVKYFEATDKRKWVKKDWVGKDATEVSRETETPYTISGLCLYLNCSRHWWNEFKKANHEGFLEVLSRIEEIIYTQKFEGAAVGAFNPMIISRDLGLKDSQEIDANVKVQDISNTQFSLKTPPPNNTDIA